MAGGVDEVHGAHAPRAVHRAVQDGHAALAVGGSAQDGADDTMLKVYLYSRAQSVMGGTSQIQRNLIAARILGMPKSR